jgi:hypothetical protein
MLKAGSIPSEADVVVVGGMQPQKNLNDMMRFIEANKKTFLWSI